MKTLLFTAAILAVLFPSTTVLAGSLMQTQQSQVLLKSGNNQLLIESPQLRTAPGAYQNVWQYQQSRFSLNAANLKQPHILSINTSKGQLSGKITVNGVVVKTLKHSKDSINLSPYLAKGKRKIEISAKSVPATSAIRVEFVGPGTRMTQEMRGSGLLRQTFIMDVY